MVLVIAFFIPVSFFTTSSGFTPVKGAIFTVLSPELAPFYMPQALGDSACADYLPSMNARISSFITRPSLPVALTLERSIPCFLARWRTAGVAKALLFDSSIAAERGVRPTFLSSSDDEDDEEVSAAFLVSAVAVVAGVAALPSSSTSISIRAFPTGQISSFLYLMLLMIPSCVEGILATNLSVKTSQISSYYRRKVQYSQKRGRYHQRFARNVIIFILPL